MTPMARIARGVTGSRKTIVFAKNSMITPSLHRRALRRELPTSQGPFARVIDYKTDEYARVADRRFSQPSKAPHIAISVDMLDTGIDVPEVANLVFFKKVRSRTKFWQMIGRGTRLCPDLFGPAATRNSSTFSTSAGTSSSSTRTPNWPRARWGVAWRQAVQGQSRTAR